MKVTWDPRAIESRKQIANYILRRFGAKHREEFLLEVRQAVLTLKHHPNMGVIDPLFVSYRRTYRSIIINGLSKLVYFIDGEDIYIAAFWDTRQEPKAQAEQVKE